MNYVKNKAKRDTWYTYRNKFAWNESVDLYYLSGIKYFISDSSRTTSYAGFKYSYFNVSYFDLDIKIM